MASNFISLSALALPFFASQVLSQSQQIIIPPKPYLGDADTQWISSSSGFDAPKNRHINWTTYDWWYFDFVQEPSESGSQASIAITFYTTGTDGFDALQEALPLYPSTNLITADVTWPNGTLDTFLFIAGEATFTVDGDGVSTNYSGTNSWFEGAPDLSQYTVELNSPEKGIVGSLVIKSDAPAHYPCGPNEEGQDLQLVPGGGWLNAIPDGDGEASFQIRGHEFNFQGRGYHDHNYGRTFSEAFIASYWGHGRLGDYVVVWVDALAADGSNHVSAYVSKDGEILTAQCGGIKVRPYGDNSTYPPTTTSGSPTGFEIQITIPDGELELKAEYTYVTAEHRVYHRYTGSFTGTLNGKALPDGVALWEQFTLQEE
ncbi:hypothetical protein ASPCAL08623 [Aspergillus calidoustus]|uniref:Hydroxyneurosporene synthase n=1 Tax=Aspergillus calidoustus TaxID=454130 RepID=A0A0U5GUU5_ASPCI|nr:hypothetical protein ASPCAL08623 [Aspergillus calidoustus]